MKITGYIATNLIMPLIVGGLMAKFLTDTSCIPSWLPLLLPCWIWRFAIAAFITAFVLDVIVYFLIPKLKSGNKITTKDNEAKLPDRKELAHQIGIDVKEFEKRFNAIENYTCQKKGARLYNAALKVLIKLDKRLVESDLVLKNAVQIRNTINNSKDLFGKYGFTLKIHFMNVGSVNRNWKSGIRPPEPFTNVAEETRELLWGTKDTSYKVQINDLINRLTMLLNKEINDGMDGK